jgi:hypothetical protein
LISSAFDGYGLAVALDIILEESAVLNEKRIQVWLHLFGMPLRSREA